MFPCITNNTPTCIDLTSTCPNCCICLLYPLVACAWPSAQWRRYSGKLMTLLLLLPLTNQGRSLIKNRTSITTRCFEAYQTPPHSLLLLLRVSAQLLQISIHRPNVVDGQNHTALTCQPLNRFRQHEALDAFTVLGLVRNLHCETCAADG